MNTSVQNIVGLFTGIWPRVVGFSGTPSLLVVALLANLVAVIPTAFRMQKDNLACDAGVTTCSKAPAAISAD